MSGRDIDALTGVRGVAVLLVFEAHLQQRYFPYHWFDGKLIANTPYIGMTIFFVLSGFVIHWNYAPLFEQEWSPRSGWKFFVARFSRLYPLYLAVTLIPLILGVASVGIFAQHIFLIQAWVFQGQSSIGYFNTWSISVEWFFYIVYAAAYPFIARSIRSGAAWLILGISCLAFAAYWAAGPVTSDADMWFRYASPYLRIFEFLTGVVAAQFVVVRRRDHRDVPTDCALLLTVIMTAALLGTALGQRTGINFAYAPAVAVALIVISDRRTFASQVLSTKWLLWIGNRSYSIYLLEAVFLHQLMPQRVFAPADFLAASVQVIFVIIGVLCLSDICWRYYEMPARSAIKRAQMVFSPIMSSQWIPK